MKEFSKTNFHKKNYFHFFFIFLIFLKYIIPLILFGSITLIYLDALDGEIVYNHIIGKVFKGNFEAIDIFLNGEIKIEYLRRIFNPYMFLYAIFDTEKAYWIIDLLVRITSYLSFFILAKKINKNLFFCFLVATLYSFCNLPTHEGFGLSIMPYLVYLGLFKNHIKLKNYIILAFFGLNTDLIMTGISIPTIVLFLIVLKKENLKNILKIFFFFSFFLALSNLNMILLSYSDETLHRVEMLRTTQSIYASINDFLINIIKLPSNLKISFLKNFPYALIFIPLVLALFFFKNNKFKQPIYVVIIVQIFLSFLTIELIANFINSNNNLIKSISWHYLNRSYILLYSISLIFFLNKKNLYSKFLVICASGSILFLIINSLIVPFYKSKILKTLNYQNLYTFKGYYNYYNFENIKKIVKNKRTLSVGIDPMVLVYNNIRVMDGYHSIYPLSYKAKFRQIIKPELDKNLKFKKYFDDWGSRVYTTSYHPIDPKNIELNFKKAKEIGAEYVVSKYIIKSADLNEIINNCTQNDLCLYKIK